MSDWTDADIYLFEKRRLMMRAWGKFTGKVQTAATVTPINNKSVA